MMTFSNTPEIPDTLTGFDEARLALTRFDARRHLFLTLEEHGFLDSDEMLLAHVDNTARLDRSVVSAYNASGDLRRIDTVYTDDLGRSLVPVSEFQVPFQLLDAPAESPLANISEDGWIVDLARLRSYDIVTDQLSTGRTMLLANLRDMLAAGEATGFLFGQDLKGPANTDTKPHRQPGA